MNENSLNQINIQTDEANIKLKSSSFIRNLSLKLKSSTKSRRHTTSLCEMNKNASIKRTNMDSSTCSYSFNSSTKPVSSNESVTFKDTNKRAFDDETKILKDCQHLSYKIPINESISGKYLTF